MKFTSVSKCHFALSLTEPRELRYMNSLISRRLGSEWVIKTSFTEQLHAYSFGFCVRLDDTRGDEIVAEVSISDESMRLSFPWKDVELPRSDEAIITADLSVISIFSFRYPQFIIGEGLISSALFYTNPHLWSDPSLVGNEISSIYRGISNELDIERKYYAFVRALHFLSGIDHVLEFMKAFRALSLLGVQPPLTKAELLITQDLSPAEIKVLKALCAKEAVDRIPNLSSRQIVSLLSNLIPGIPSDQYKAKVERSLLSRGLREGLTLTELSLVVGMDKAYLWRYVLPKMVEGCLVIVERDQSRGKEVKVYRPNPYITLVSDLIMTYDLTISHLLRMR